MSVAAGVVAGVGVLICVLAVIRAALARDALDRLHFVTPVTSAGTPLIGLGLALRSGWNLATALVLLCVVVSFAAGPVLASETGRVLHAERDL